MALPLSTSDLWGQVSSCGGAVLRRPGGCHFLVFPSGRNAGGDEADDSTRNRIRELEEHHANTVHSESSARFEPQCYVDSAVKQ